MYFSEDMLTGNPETHMEIASYPDKFSDDITVEISADTEDHCIITLSNQTGRILRMMGVNVFQGKTQVHVDNVVSLEAGTYQLSVKNTNSNILYSSILTKF
jgi:methionine-rich copper-binding protein CopC